MVMKKLPMKKPVEVNTKPKTYGAKAAQELRENSRFLDLSLKHKVFNKHKGTPAMAKVRPHIKNELNKMILVKRLEKRFEKDPVLFKKIEKNINELFTNNKFTTLPETQQEKIILSIMKNINKLSDNTVQDYTNSLKRRMVDFY